MHDWINEQPTEDKSTNVLDAEEAKPRPLKNSDIPEKQRRKKMMMMAQGTRTPEVSSVRMHGVDGNDCAERKVHSEPGWVSTRGGKPRPFLVPDGEEKKTQQDDCASAHPGSPAVLRPLASLGPWNPSTLESHPEQETRRTLERQILVPLPRPFVQHQKQVIIYMDQQSPEVLRLGAKGTCVQI
ncbi:hypothetical protein STEG23_012969 [Scotinomys teguina]